MYSNIMLLRIMNKSCIFKMNLEILLFVHSTKATSLIELCDKHRLE